MLLWADFIFIKLLFEFENSLSSSSSLSISFWEVFFIFKLDIIFCRDVIWDSIEDVISSSGFILAMRSSSIMLFLLADI